MKTDTTIILKNIVVNSLILSKRFLKHTLADFLERPDIYARTLFVCRITDWTIDSFYAEGYESLL